MPPLPKRSASGETTIFGPKTQGGAVFSKTFLNFFRQHLATCQKVPKMFKNRAFVVLPPYYSIYGFFRKKSKCASNILKNESELIKIMGLTLYFLKVMSLQVPNQKLFSQLTFLGRPSRN